LSTIIGSQPDMLLVVQAGNAVEAFAEFAFTKLRVEFVRRDCSVSPSNLY
jgi:hypothetical protein